MSVQQATLSGIDDCSGMIVIPREILKKISDPFAGWVLVKILSQEIGGGGQTINEMAQICDQNRARFQESLKQLQTCGLVKIHEKKITGRTHPELQIVSNCNTSNLTTVLQESYDTRYTNIHNKCNTSNTNNNQSATEQLNNSNDDEESSKSKKPYLPGWGKKATYEVLKLFDILQNIDPSTVPTEMHKADVRAAASIARTYTPEYIHDRWPAIRHKFNNAEGRVSLRVIIKYLPRRNSDEDQRKPDSKPGKSSKEDRKRQASLIFNN
jgi:predicted transcriptional regulator